MPDIYADSIDKVLLHITLLRKKFYNGDDSSWHTTAGTLALLKEAGDLVLAIQEHLATLNNVESGIYAHIPTADEIMTPVEFMEDYRKKTEVMVSEFEKEYSSIVLPAIEAENKRKKG